MDEKIFKQLQIVQQNTINAVKDLTEEQLDIIPDGFNNNIRWNLGHIFYIQELFAYYFPGDQVQVQENIPRLFAKGSKPADWDEDVPTLEILLDLLSNQPTRIKESLQDRLNDPLKTPFRRGDGVTFDSVGELLSFSLFHEGMHYNTINLLKRFSKERV